MKVYIDCKSHDIQNDAELGIIVMCNGKLIRRGTKRYEKAVQEFRIATQEAAEEAKMFARMTAPR